MWDTIYIAIKKNVFCFYFIVPTIAIMYLLFTVYPEIPRSEAEGELVEVSVIRVLNRREDLVHLSLNTFPNAMDPLIDGMVLTHSIISIPPTSEATDIDVQSCWVKTGRLKESGIAICQHCLYSVNSDGSLPILLACIDSMTCNTLLRWEQQKYVLLLQLEPNGDVVVASKAP